jgi:hypothetical protein
MIYIVIIFLIIGVWQAFMKGSKSEMIGGISFWLAIIIFVTGFAVGKIEMDIKSLAILGLISFFILYYVVSRFKFMENLKIREIIYTYRELKENNPNLNKDEICRLTIHKRLRENYLLYDKILVNNSDKEITNFIKDIFKKELDIKYICMWLMEHEYPKYDVFNNSHNLDGWREKNKELEGRIEYYLRKVPNL